MGNSGNMTRRECKYYVHEMENGFQVTMAPDDAITLWGVLPGSDHEGFNTGKKTPRECDADECDCTSEFSNYYNIRVPDEDGYPFYMELTVNNQVYRYMVSPHFWENDQYMEYKVYCIKGKTLDLLRGGDMFSFKSCGSSDYDRSLHMTYNGMTPETVTVNVTKDGPFRIHAEDIGEKRDKEIKELCDLIAEIYNSSGMPGENLDCCDEPTVLQMLKEIYYVPGMPGSAVGWKQVQQEKFARLMSMDKE